MIRIKINDTYIDLGDNEFAVTRQTIDFKNVGSRSGDYSTNYTIPNNDVNNPIFGYLIKLGFSSAPFQKIPAIIEDDGLVISKGFAKVTGITEEEISFTFFGGNSDWFEDIKGSNISEVDTRELDHTYTGANVTGSFSNTWEDGYIYPIIDYGRFRGVTYSSIGTGDILPAMFCKWLFLKIFDEIGWRVKGDLLSNYRFNRMILPTVNKLDRKREWVQSRSVRSFLSVDQVIPISSETVLQINIVDKSELFPNAYEGYVNEDGIRITNGNFNTSTYRYTADDAITLNINGYYNFSAGVGTSLGIGYKVNGGSYVSMKAGVVGVASFNASVSLTAGDYVEIIAKNTSGVNTFTAFANRGTWAQFIPSSNLALNQTVFMKDALPTIDKSDFIKDILMRFGCLVTANNEKKEITFTTFESIKSKGVVDWSGKLDLSEGYQVDYEEQLQDYGKNNYFKSKEDSNDLFLVDYNSKNDLDFGDGNLKFSSEWLSGNEDIYESPFAATTVYEAFDSELLLPHITKYSSSSLGVTEADIQPEPRILLISPVFDIQEFGTLTSISILGSSVTEIPFAFYCKPVLSGDFDAFNHTLGFGAAFGYDDSNLLDEYYPTIRKILNKPSLLKCRIRLTSKDWATLDMLKPIYLSQFEGRFLINKIDQYQFNNESTDIELIKL